MSKSIKFTLMIMIATLGSKLLGFFRDIILASFYGATAYTDGYIIAQTFPNILFNIFGQSIAIILIPLFLEIRENQNEDSLVDFINNLLHIIIFTSVGLCVIGMIFTENIVKILAKGFDGQALDITILLTRIMIPMIIFLGVNHIFIAFLQANDNYIVPSMLGIPTNIVIIISIYISSFYGIKVLAYGTLLGMFVQVLVQIPFVISKGYKYELKMDFNDKNIKKLFLLVFPVFLGIAVKEINTIIDRTLASTLIEGSISALSFAHKIDMVVFGVFSLSIVTVAYKQFSQAVAEDNHQAFNKLVYRSFNIIVIVLIPITIAIMILAKPIVRALFERGVFGLEASQMTADALFYYAIGILGFGLRELATRIFYSLKDTKTPMINGVVSVALNIILNLVLIQYMGHRGLALGTSIAVTFTAILLIFSLRKRIGIFYIKGDLTAFIKVCIATAIMGICIVKFYNFIFSFCGEGFGYGVLALGLTSIIGALIYFFLLIILKIKEVDYIYNVIMKKIIN